MISSEMWGSSACHDKVSSTQEDTRLDVHYTHKGALEECEVRHSRRLRQRENGQEPDAELYGRWRTWWFKLSQMMSQENG